jgi:hypothetical protein
VRSPSCRGSGPAPHTHGSARALTARFGSAPEPPEVGQRAHWCGGRQHRFLRGRDEDSRVRVEALLAVFLALDSLLSTRKTGARCMLHTDARDIGRATLYVAECCRILASHLSPCRRLPSAHTAVQGWPTRYRLRLRVVHVRSTV